MWVFWNICLADTWQDEVEREAGVHQSSISGTTVPFGMDSFLKLNLMEEGKRPQMPNFYSVTRISTSSSFQEFSEKDEKETKCLCCFSKRGLFCFLMCLKANHQIGPLCLSGNWASWGGKKLPQGAWLSITYCFQHFLNTALYNGSNENWVEVNLLNLKTPSLID